MLSYNNLFYEFETIHLVTNYFNKGDLLKIITKGNLICENRIWSILIQVGFAIEYLHFHNIIHRDIKPANIYLDGEDNVVLGDYGICKIDTNAYYNTQIGTPLYMSPEIIKSGSYSKKTDIWSYGCTLYELVMLRPPFTGRNIFSLNRNIERKKINQDIKESKYSRDLIVYIEFCMEKYESKRPSIDSLMHLKCISEHLYLIPYKFEKK